MSGGTLNQPYVFLATVYGGLICGALYCIFKTARVAMKAGRPMSAILDSAFILMSSCVCIYILYTTTLLDLRLYHFVGVALGFSVFVWAVAPVLSIIYKRLKRATVDKRRKKSDN